MIEWAKEKYSDTCKNLGHEEVKDGWEIFVQESIKECPIPEYCFEDRYRCCSCHIMPPCSYCTDGGYCKEHECMRIDCGCEE
jgi:hypothetical protein